MNLFISGLVLVSTIVAAHAACECGIEPLKTRVVGGRATKLNQYPWMVHLLISADGKGWGSCGSSIINDQWIVTAAHCFEPGSTGGAWNNPADNDWVKRPLKHRVVATMGAQNSEYTGDFIRNDKNLVEKVIVHPDYARGSKPVGNFINDIALIKLKTKLTFDKTKAPICLGAVKGEVDTFLSGWGLQTNSSGKIVEAKEMYEVDLQLEKCPYNPDHFLCAKGVRHGAGRGDSGGPLSVRRGGVVVQVGIVSHGDDEERIAKGVHVSDKYTMVEKHREWIKKTTAGSEFCAKSFA